MHTYTARLRFWERKKSPCSEGISWDIKKQKRLPRFAPIARLSLGLSVVSLVVSMIFIGIDLGAIRHSLGTLLFFHWSSPLAWEIKAYLFFMAVAVVQFALVLWNDKRAAAELRTRRVERGDGRVAVRA